MGLKTPQDTELAKIHALSEGLPEARPEDAQPAILQQRYVLDRLVGQGSSGEVYRARQVRLDRTVAVKILHSGPEASTPGAQDRFRREAMILGRLNHPNVVSVYDFGETEDGRPYLVMEFLSGRLLTDLLAGPALDDYQTLAIAFQVIKALAALEDAGLSHFDLKPSDIMVTEGPDRAVSGSVKLLDFGVFQRIDTRSQDDGAFGFMAPERFDGFPPDSRSVVYSLGALWYALVSGQPPFEGESLESLADQHRYTSVLPLAVAGHRRAPPGRVESIIRRCLAKRPTDRYESLAQVQVELHEYLRVSYPASAVLEELYDRPPSLEISTARRASRSREMVMTHHPAAASTTLPVRPLVLSAEVEPLGRRWWVALWVLLPLVVALASLSWLRFRTQEPETTIIQYRVPTDDVPPPKPRTTLPPPPPESIPAPAEPVEEVSDDEPPEVRRRRRPSRERRTGRPGRTRKNATRLSPRDDRVLEEPKDAPQLPESNVPYLDDDRDMTVD